MQPYESAAGFCILLRAFFHDFMVCLSVCSLFVFDAMQNVLLTGLFCTRLKDGGKKHVRNE